MVEEEALLTKEARLEEGVEVEEEEATQDRDPQELHHLEETQSPLDLISPLTYDQFPVPTMQSQWESSPMSSTEIGPKQRRSLTS